MKKSKDRPEVSLTISYENDSSQYWPDPVKLISDRLKEGFSFPPFSDFGLKKSTPQLLAEIKTFEEDIAILKRWMLRKWTKLQRL